MRKFTFSIVFFLITISAYAQETKYFETKRDYIYTVVYIDSIGDTITNEKLIIRIPDKRWIAQPRVQKSVIYIYDTDTIDYKKFVNSDTYQHERNQRLYQKNGEFPLSKKETTGGLESKRYSYIYMHPPRRNQYYMLFHAPHPYFFYSALEKESDTALITNQQFYGAGYMHQEYIYQNLGKNEVLGDSMNTYQINVSSDLVTKKEYFLKEIDLYSSTLDALFCMEYGFIKMHYEFKNGVRIEFDLVKVVEND